MIVEAVALREGQWSESAVRDGNDNIGHAHDPPVVAHSFDAPFWLSKKARKWGDDRPPSRLTSSLVRPECIILLRRVILQNFREYPHVLPLKKHTSPTRTRCYASREKWLSLPSAGRAAFLRWWGVTAEKRDHFLNVAEPSPLIRWAHSTWRQHRQSLPLCPLFTRFRLDRYFYDTLHCPERHLPFTIDISVSTNVGNITIDKVDPLLSILPISRFILLLILATSATGMDRI